MKGVKFTAREKKRILDMWLVQRKHWLYICKHEKCTRVSLWRWKKQYDGTLESLENKSSRPHTPHPNSQTEEEKREILEVVQDNPTMGYTELYGELRAKYAYSRHYKTMYKYVRSLRLRPAEIYDRYVAQPYDTPEMFGQKWQMDVKFVPRVCYAGKDPFERAFQYTTKPPASVLFTHTRNTAVIRPPTSYKGRCCTSGTRRSQFKPTTERSSRTPKGRATVRFILPTG